MSEIKAAISEEEIENVVGGAASKTTITVGGVYVTHVDKGYLALRNYPAYDEKNEIGPLWNGSKVVVTEYTAGSLYAVVAVNYCPPLTDKQWGPSVEGRVGYVNVTYLF